MDEIESVGVVAVSQQLGKSRFIDVIHQISIEDDEIRSKNKRYDAS